ncbi:5042_t:CDS:2, partial [Racocetra fulgida]
MNNQYCSVHKTTPYNVVFGQLSHSDTNIVDILENDNRDDHNNSFENEESESFENEESESFKNKDLLENELDLHYFLPESSEDELDPSYFLAEDNENYSSEEGVSPEIMVISDNSDAEVETIYQKGKTKANLIEPQ